MHFLEQNRQTSLACSCIKAIEEYTTTDTHLGIFFLLLIWRWLGNVAGNKAIAALLTAAADVGAHRQRPE